MFLRKKSKHQQQNVAASEKVTKAKTAHQSASSTSAPLFARFSSTNPTSIDGSNGSAPSKPMVSGPMSLATRRESTFNVNGGKAGIGKAGSQRLGGGQPGQPWNASDKLDKPLPPTLPSDAVKPILEHRTSTSGPVPVDLSRLSRKTTTQKSRAADVADTAENTEPQSHLSSRLSTTNTTRKSSIQDLPHADPTSRSARAGTSYDAPLDSVNPSRNNLVSRQTHPTYAHGPISSADIGPDLSHRNSSFNTSLCLVPAVPA
ncbi:hypothetical protein C8R42DRAFT_654986 [Lentinula raphanica]|nr:hypothetical protein C8R42DRAFT_654986 [Lentinula raphanica]